MVRTKRVTTRPSPQQGGEGFAHGETPAHRGVAPRALNGEEVDRDLHARGIDAPRILEHGKRVGAEWVDERDGRIARSLARGPRFGGMRARQRPGDHRAVGGERTVQRAPGVGAVDVLDVLDGECAEPVDVEVRVARHQRVRRPEHRLDADPHHLLPLEMLQPVADVMPARFLAHGEHVGPVDGLAALHAGQPEHKADHAIIRVERPRGHSTDLLRYAQDRGRYALGKAAPPRFLLNLAAFGIFLQRPQVAYADGVERIGHPTGPHASVKLAPLSGAK